MEKSIQAIRKLTDRISLELFGTKFILRVERDNQAKWVRKGRIFLQITYDNKCQKTGELKEWHGRKWYLSDYMTEDEVVKTAYAAFKMAVEHEIMEAFKFSGVTVFNPHLNYEELIAISHKEVKRS